MNSTPTPSPDVFRIERHGDLILVAATPALERIDAIIEEQAAQLADRASAPLKPADLIQGVEQEVAEIIMNCLRDEKTPLVLFDLSEVDYFNSMFLALLLKCWKLTTARGGSMALAGVSEHARELLRVTSLDMIFPMYPTRREAMESLLSN